MPKDNILLKDLSDTGILCLKLSDVAPQRALRSHARPARHRLFRGRLNAFETRSEATAGIVAWIR